MRSIRRVCLLVILTLVSSSQAQDAYPACWESELTTSLVSVPFYESYFSWLEEVETADELVEFAESHLPSRGRDWRSNEGCAEAVELTWLAQRELSLRAAYKAVALGMRAKVDVEPDVLAGYNPLRAIVADPFYPAPFTQLAADHKALIDSGERHYELSAEEDALPACSDAQLASLTPLMPDYRQIMDDSTEIGSMDDLLELAQRQIEWREQWARNTVEPKADGTIHFPPKDGLKLLPPCHEAAELLWLMNRAMADVITGTALFYAGVTTEEHPYIEVFNRNDDRVLAFFERIESITAEPAPIGKWTSCNQHTEDAMRERLPEFSAIIDDQAGISSLDEYLAFAKSEVEWRQQLWAGLPNCAEALEIALELSRAAGDVSVAMALSLAGVDLESNPYVEWLTSGAAVAESLHYGTLGGSRFRDEPQRLRSCTEAELDSLEIVIAQYHGYREAMFDFANLREFMTIAESLYGWRDGLRAALPACKEALDLGSLMTQIADDYIALFGLVYAGYGRDSNPYFESFQTGSFELVDLLQAVGFKSGPRAVVWDYGGQMEDCRGDSLDTLSKVLGEYLALLEMGRSINSLEALSAFGDAQIAWRSDIWPQLPNCAEAFEVGLHIYRSAGDRILFDVPAIAEDKLADIIAGDTLLNTRLGEIYANLPIQWRPQHSGQLESHRQQCSSAQTAEIMDSLRGYAELVDGTGDFNADPAALRDSIDRRIQWRQDNALEMPRCRIVFELDDLPAFDLAESITSNIPVLGAVLSGGDILQAISASLSGAESSVQALRPNSNRMPLCSEAELRSLQSNLPTYVRIIDDEANSRDRLGSFAYIRQKLDWRKEVWERIPHCAEAVEVAFLIDQVASDITTGDALRLLDMADRENPYLHLQDRGRTALRNTREKIAALINSGARQDTPSSSDSPLPRCTEAESDVVIKYTFGRRLFPSFKEETLQALKEYIAHALSWRGETWAPLPACLEAYIFGLLVSQHMGDLVSHEALEWSGVRRSQNPFFPDIRQDVFDLVELTEALSKSNSKDLNRFVEDYISRSA